APAPTSAIYTLSLHDALPILLGNAVGPTDSWLAEVESSSTGPEGDGVVPTISAIGLLQGDSARISTGKLKLISLPQADAGLAVRSEEHTSELQSRFDLVCRLL